MRLLFDHNLSPKLVRRLRDLFPGSVHVREVDLHEVDDTEVWSYAQANDLIIVSKDGDFHSLSLLNGPPSRLVWVRLGNCTTLEIERSLRRHHRDLARFSKDRIESCLVIEPPGRDH